MPRPVQHTAIYEERTVIEAAESRMAEIFDACDTPFVSYSGGKDSTCTLELALQEARRRGRTLDVLFFDEEIVDPDTLAYVERVKERPDVFLHWLCVPIQHTLRGETRSSWFTWDPDARDVWFRPLPEGAITTIPGFERGLMSVASILYWDPNAHGVTGCITGIRAGESLNRHRALLTAGHFITHRFHRKRHQIYGKPIYDWTTNDIWWAIREFGWDYSRAYDKQQQFGRSLKQQRVAPWGNASGSKETEQFATFYPDEWDRAIRRLPELKAQARYGKTKLYRKTLDKPAGLTWQEWTFKIIEDIENPTDRERLVSLIKRELKRWAKTHSIPLPDESISVDGARLPWSWQRLAFLAAKNDALQGGFRDA